ncbi:metallophosphoesterase family protein [Canibacter zhoujuaniae]|uniref:metallophosphoesterase family protein n=1 Tax=Canibacter zhoujuaniae TaxID=2708343 RepID=UPI00141D81F3|nr:metallophosphoesterase [Canibacter zhoujuaniae]
MSTPYSPPELTIAHLSDLHLVAPGTLLFEQIDTWRRTREAFATAMAHEPAIFLVTGDIAERFHEIRPAADELLQEMADTYRRTIITIPGNHDLQSDFTQSVYVPGGTVGVAPSSAGVTPASAPGDHRGTVPLGEARISYGPEPADSVFETAQLRVISLNSHGYRVAQGHLTDAQLEWLSAELGRSDSSALQQRTVITLHHPPVANPYIEMRNIGLRGQQEFADILRGAKSAGARIDAILCGHYHITQAASIADVPVWVTPAVAYQGDPTVGRGRVRGRDYGFVSLIRFAEDRDYSALAIKFAGAGAELFDREIIRELLP